MTMSKYWQSMNNKRNKINLNIDDCHCYRCGERFPIWDNAHYHNPGLNCNFCIRCGEKLQKLFKAAKEIQHGPFYRILRTMEIEDGKRKTKDNR